MSKIIDQNWQISGRNQLCMVIQKLYLGKLPKMIIAHFLDLKVKKSSRKFVNIYIYENHAKNETKLATKAKIMIQIFPY